MKIFTVEMKNKMGIQNKNFKISIKKSLNI